MIEEAERREEKYVEMFGRYYNPPCMHFVEVQNVERQIVEIQIEYLCTWVCTSEYRYH
jgi:hypothetical protein